MLLIKTESKSKGKLSTLEKGDNDIELSIVDTFATSNFIEKEYAKIINENPDIERKKMIPMLIETVYHTLIDEEMYNIIKKYKNPKILIF